MRSVLLGCTCLAASVAVALAAPETRPAGELLREWGDRFRVSVRAEPGVEEVPVAASPSVNMERSLNGLKRATRALSWARWDAEGEVDDAEIGMLGRAQSRIKGAWMAVARPKSPTLRVFQEAEKTGSLAQYVVFGAEEEAGRRLVPLERCQQPVPCRLLGCKFRARRQGSSAHPLAPDRAMLCSR